MNRPPRVVVAAIALCATAAGAAPAARPLPALRQERQVPVYGARVEVVRVHAAVLSDGRPVTDLTAEDFVVVDNGVEHPVALALTPRDAPIDVVLAFDQSESIRQAAPTVKRDARAFLDALGYDDCALVLPFQHTVGPGVWGPSVAPALLDIIDLTSLEGGTSLHDALIVALAAVQRGNIPAVLAARVATEYEQPTIEGGIGIDFGEHDDAAAAPAPAAAGFSTADLPFRLFSSSYGCGATDGQVDRRRAVVVLSDGVDTTSVHTFGELLALVYRTDAPIFPVVIGNPGADDPAVSSDMRRAARTADRNLEQLAEVTGGRFVRASGSQSRLRAAYDEIVTILRGSYLLGYYPSGAGRDTGAPHELEVKVRRAGVEVFARREYTPADFATETAHEALRRGSELLLAGQAEQALQQAGTATSAAPADWEGYMLAAAAMWMQDDPGAALPPLQRVLRLAPGVPAAHFLAWQLHYDLGNDRAAWQQAIQAQLAGADMQEPMRMLRQRSAPPADLQARLAVRRIFVEGPRGDDPAAYARLAGVVGTLSRAVSDSPYCGLVRDPIAADYYLYVAAGDVDSRRPAALESRLELYDYTDRRLWREDLDVADLDDPEQVADAVSNAMAELEEWLQEGR